MRVGWRTPGPPPPRVKLGRFKPHLMYDVRDPNEPACDRCGLHGEHVCLDSIYKVAGTRYPVDAGE